MNTVVHEAAHVIERSTRGAFTALAIAEELAAAGLLASDVDEPQQPQRKETP